MSAEGLLAGLQSAIGSYYDTVKSREDRAAQKKEKELLLRIQGYQPTYDEKGGLLDVVKTPQKMKEEKDAENLGLIKAGFIPADLDPTQLPKVNEAYLRSKALSNPFAGISPGQKAVDTSFGKEYSDYKAAGGESGVKKNLGQLQSAVEDLKNNPDLTGGITTKIPFLNSDAAQDVINPKMAKVRDQIKGAIQSTLRQTLGSQFTEREGEAIFNRAFNPRLSAEENIRRAQAEIDALTRQATQKNAASNYFEQHGTLQGFNADAVNSAPGLLQNLAPSSAGAAPQMGPKPGTIENGYRFKGGNPSDQNNWEKIK